jgi:uncharacterized protein (TIGR03437 family)
VVQVRNGSFTLPEFHVSVDPTIWEIFQNAAGSAVAINQASKPAKAGSIVSIWATGFGNDAGPVSGAVATSAFDWTD